MTKLRIGSGFGVPVPSTYREYKYLLDLLTSNGVLVQDELFYDPEYYLYSEQSKLWYERNHHAYKANLWEVYGVIERDGELVTLVSDDKGNYSTAYDSVEAMVQARTKTADEEVVLSDLIKGFDDFDVTLRVGGKTVSFGAYSQAHLGNRANDPFPELTYLRTLEQVEAALKDDSVTVLWGVGNGGGLIKPNHLTREVKLMHVADMMQEGIYVAAKK
mgnify:CR=1 FL=1